MIQFCLYLETVKGRNFLKSEKEGKTPRQRSSGNANHEGQHSDNLL